MTSGKGVDDLIKTLMKKKVKKVFLPKAPAVHVQLATNKITNVLQNAKMPRRNVNYFKINKVIKVTMKQIFLLSYSKKGFQNIKEWYLFYCDSTLGCR